MSRSSKFDYQAAIESNLFTSPDGLTLDELLQRSELQVDRSTLFRHLSRLIENGRAERIGKARATRYRLLGAAPTAPGSTQLAAAPAAIQAAPDLRESDAPNAAPSAPDHSGLPRAEPDGIAAEPRADSTSNRSEPPSPVQPEATTPNPPSSFRSDPTLSAAKAQPVPIENSTHRGLLIKAVRRIVRERKRFDPVNMEIYLSLLVPREELDEFSKVVTRELAGLNADNLYRYDLSPAEFSGFTPIEEFSEAGGN